MMDDALKTPLKKVRGLGSAKSGTEHFWHQRLTAMANIPLLIGAVWFVIAHLGASRAEVVASLGDIGEPFRKQFLYLVSRASRGKCDNDCHRNLVCLCDRIQKKAFR